MTEGRSCSVDDTYSIRPPLDFFIAFVKPPTMVRRFRAAVARHVLPAVGGSGIVLGSGGGLLIGSLGVKIQASGHTLD